MKIKSTSLLVLLLHRVFAHVQNLRFQVHVEQVLRRDQVPRCPRVLQRQLLPRCLLLTQLLELVPHFFVRLH